MKKFILILLVIILSVLSMSYSNDEYSEWIPKDALDAANKYWISFHDEADDESIRHQFGLSGRYDISQCELRYGFQVITINYEEYEVGKKVFDYFDKTCGGRCQYAYGFGVYFNNMHIGEIEVAFIDDYWQIIGTRGFGSLKKRDFIEEIFSSYPSSLGYHVYKENMGIFFEVKYDSVLTAFTGDAVDKEYNETDPNEYLLKNKELRIIKK